MTFKTLTLALLLLSLMTFLLPSNAFAAECGGNIECQCGDTLVASYIMDSNIESCSGEEGIEIDKINNIVLDCQGHSISADNSHGSGLSLDDTQNFTVKNCVIDGFRNGINYRGDSVGTIENIQIKNSESRDIAFFRNSCQNTMLNVTGAGNLPVVYLNSQTNFIGENVAQLILCNADNSYIANITVGVEDVKSNGVYAYLTDDSTFDSIVSSNNNDGLNLIVSHNNLVQNSQFDNNARYGLSLRGSQDNLISHNTMMDNGAYDLDIDPNQENTDSCTNDITDSIGSGGRPIIFINDKSHVKDIITSQLILCGADGTTIENVRVSGYEDNYNNGAYILHSTDVVVNELTVEFTDDGLYIFGSTDLTVKNSVFTDNDEGIEIVSDDGFDSSNIKILNNRIYNNFGSGVSVEYSKDITVKKNKIYNNGGHGIVFDGGDTFGSIKENSIGFNLHSGMRLDASENKKTIVSDNVITKNNDGGLRLQEGLLHVTKNIISKNSEYGINGRASGNDVSPLIYNNYIIDNEINAIETEEDSVAQWHYEEQGNFWSDFEDNEGFPKAYVISGPGPGVDLFAQSADYPQLKSRN